MSDYILVSFYIITAVVFIALCIVMPICRAVKDNKLMNTVTNKTRGTRSERRLVVALLRSGIPAEDIYHDLYLEYLPDHYSQIDVVVITPAGLVVFEEKDYSGWIFGKGWQDRWTQVLNYGQEKHRFYNPVKQNESHINFLKMAFVNELDGVRIISYIVFHGNCELKNVTELPRDVVVTYGDFVGKAMKVIYAEPPVNYPDQEAVRRVLRQAERNGRDPQVISRHIENLKKYKARN